MSRHCSLSRASARLEPIDLADDGDGNEKQDSAATSECGYSGGYNA